MKETNPNLIRLVSDMMGVHHYDMSDISDHEKSGDLKLVVNEVPWQGQYCYVLRAHALETDRWFVEEIEPQQASAIIMQQQMNALFNLFKKPESDEWSEEQPEETHPLFKIFGLSDNPEHQKNMESIYELKKNDGDFDEDELISEDEFKRMMEGG
jgi:hypothetical protein